MTRDTGAEMAFVTAPHCPHCRAMEPIVERVAGDYGQITTTTISVAEEPDSARQLDVWSTPTLVSRRDGEVLGKVVGRTSENEIRALYEATAQGLRSKARISRSDRVMRTATGLVLIGWGLAASVPLLAVVGLPVLALGWYDLLRKS